METPEKPAEEVSASNGSPGSPGSNGSSASPSQAAAEREIETLKAEVKEKENKFLYLYAEFDNFKKRMQKERSDLIKFGWEPVARELLQVVDNLERAIQHMPPSTDKNLAQGLEMVVNLFRSTLEKQGVQLIETVGKPFDPNLHEAVGTEPSSSAEGTITREQQRGYLLHGRLLRPAQVLVSAGS